MDIRNFGFLLADVTRLYVKHFERHAGEIGVTLPQARVLAYLARNEGATQSRIAELSQTDPMTLVRILDRMEQDGWIERRADAGDRRVRRLHLLAPARPMLDAIAELASRARSVALAGLGTPDHEKMLRLLDHVHANLVQAEEPAVPAAAAVKPGAPRPARRIARRSGSE